MASEGASYGQQTKALVKKSWAYQKRNIGTNICLCIAPIFFCVVLALIQVAVNIAFLDSDELKCGCFCESCCPTWALKSQPGNYTSDGQGTITILNPATFGPGYNIVTNLLPASVSNIRNNSDGSVTLSVCSQVASGACPTDFDFTCVKKDTSRCGVQFSSTSQAQWCAVPQPSTWPALIQTPDRDERAAPWGNLTVNGIKVNQSATLITAADSNLASRVAGLLFNGRLLNDNALFNRTIAGLYSGNASDPKSGNVFNGDMLSLMGLQLGSSSDLQISLQSERTFTRDNPFVMMPAGECIRRNISTADELCLKDFLRSFYNTSGGPVPTLLSSLQPCPPASPLDRLAKNTDPDKLLDVLRVKVFCSENAVIPQANAAAVDDKLYCGYYQARCNGIISANQFYQGAIDLMNSSSGGLAMDVYYNESLSLSRGSPSVVQRLPGSIATAVAAWWEATTGNDPAASGIKLLGVMDMPKDENKLKLDFSSILGALFFCWVVQLLFPTFLQQLVYEKEKRLRMMMKMHGLGDGTYWTVTFGWYLVMYVAYIAIFIIIGAIVRLKLFYLTNVGLQIVFYFLNGLCMISFAFMLSSFFTNSKTAVIVAFLYVFGSGLIGELLLKRFMERDKDWVFYVQWIPAFALYRGLYEMTEYTFVGNYRGTSGLNWTTITDPGNGMRAVWGIFVVESIIFVILGLYFEQIISSGTGIRRHPLFFLEWFKKKKPSQAPARHSLDGDRVSRTSLDGKMTALNMSGAIPGLSDVAAEEQRVQALQSYENDPIVMKDIKKVYPALNGGKPKTAVRKMTLGIQRGECFGLLGPNGAGKTTTINMLVGFLEPSGGTGIIEGNDIRKDMSSIYKIMGVCPQHDLLWEQLSGREHLRFYGMLKGLAGQELEDAVDAALKAVNLYNAGVGDKQAGQYSGGMKRRLSVAISFIGSPKVVYLDEPSTGLDPASRQNLWDVVKSSKAGRSIILTTHSMQEAEQLCDRLGIFVDGQLVCIGNPKEITSRYAGFYVFTISVPPSEEPAARQMVKEMSPNAVLTYELGGTLKYELPTTDVALSAVFSKVKAAKAAGLHVLDWGVSNATLEEVFIKLAKNVGATSQDS